MNKRIAYISGPMTGYVDNNFPAFNKKAAELTSLGIQVENPTANEGGADSWNGYMRLAVTQLMRCTEIHMLKGWEFSKGARTEHELACKLGFEIYYA
jgi:Domain of unknown function (DUF4406)